MSARKKRKVSEEDTSIDISDPTGEDFCSESLLMGLDELFAFCDENIITQPNDIVVGSGAPIHSAAVSNKPDVNLRWVERVGSYFAPTTACTFEIVFPNPSQKEVSFGFTLQWQRLPYSVRNLNRWLLYCTVASVISDYSNILSKGDILLKVDDRCMYYQPGDAVNYDELESKLLGITSASTTVRILRPAAASANMTLSPIEIISYAAEKVPTAKFIASSKMLKDGTLRPVLENTALETQAPATVKRMMLGSKVNWVTIPNFIREGTMDGRLALMKSVNAAVTASGTAPTPAQLLHPQAGVFVPMMSVNDVTTFDEQLFSTDTNGGLYRDKNRFVTIFVDNPPPNTSESGPLLTSQTKAMKRVFNLGRFDSEEEASRTYFRAVKVKEMYGSFEPRYYLKELARKPLPPPPAVVPVAPVIPPSQAHHHPVIPAQQASNYQKMMQHQQQIQRQGGSQPQQHASAYPVYPQQQQQMARTGTAPSAGTFPTQQQMRQYQAPTATGLAPAFPHFPTQAQQSMYNPVLQQQQGQQPQQLYRPNTMPAQQNYLQQPQTGFSNNAFQQRMVPPSYPPAQHHGQQQFTPAQQSAIATQQLQAHNQHPHQQVQQVQGQQPPRLAFNQQQTNPQDYNNLLLQQQRYQQQQQQQLQQQQQKQYPNQPGGGAQGGGRS